MAEYIECRKCDSPYCDGCNTLTLSKMLHARKFDCLLDEHHCINPCADVEVVVRCGECVKRHTELCSLYIGQMNEKAYFIQQGDDFFCKKGRRDSDG